MANDTPFRYPGAKNKLLPNLWPYLDVMLKDASSFSDGFVGGGSVLLAVAKKYPNIKLYANDKDYSVYCFWKVITDKDPAQLNQLLALMEDTPTIELFNGLREEPPMSEVDFAYRAIFFNRTTFSGIATSGAIGGTEQKSKWKIDCRYNYPKLNAKIEKCRELLCGRFEIENQDIAQYKYLTESNDPIYLDPPYFVKGDMLYPAKMNDAHHKELSLILQGRKNWVLSYDDCEEIRGYYEGNQIDPINVRYCINGKKTDWKGKEELIVVPK